MLCLMRCKCLFLDFSLREIFFQELSDGLWEAQTVSAEVLPTPNKKQKSWEFHMGKLIFITDNDSFQQWFNTSDTGWWWLSKGRSVFWNTSPIMCFSLLLRLQIRHVLLPDWLLCVLCFLVTTDAAKDRHVVHTDGSPVPQQAERFGTQDLFAQLEPLLGHTREWKTLKSVFIRV